MPTATFSLPLAADIREDNPWERAYLKAPNLGEPNPLSFPVKDVRADIFKENSSEYLSRYGFTAVHHPSQLQNKPDFEDLDKLEDVYFPEIKDMIKRLTGASEVFITNSILRRSTPAQKEKTLSSDTSKRTPNKSLEQTISSTGVLLNKDVSPARFPHLDYTPLSARQVIRKWRVDINAAAEEHGIILHEDDLCRTEGVQPTEEQSDTIIVERYNNTNGPRYAAFSVWRPLLPVDRDPLAMLPQKHFHEHCSSGHSRLELYKYLIRVPGDAKLGGDFLRQLAMLTIKPADQHAAQHSNQELEWYYISNQTPDEALVVKFFDSAALGSDVEEADAPIHGSPDLGDGGSGAPRESIEVRVIAFW